MRKLTSHIALDGATYRAKSFLSGGGVGRNIAEGLYKLHGNVHLISAIGNDENGRSLNSYLPATATNGVIIDTKNATSICAVICDTQGDCKLVLGDMKIHSSITPELIMRHDQMIAAAPLIVMDANIGTDTMEALLTTARRHNKPVFFEPTDMRIADKPFHLEKPLTDQIKFISPNIFELHKIVGVMDNLTSSSIDINTTTNSNTLKTAKQLLTRIAERFDIIIVTLGPLGVIVASKSNVYPARNNRKEYGVEQADIRIQHYLAPRLNNIVNVSGAGDSFTSGFIAAMLNGLSEGSCVAFGFRAAQCALMSESAVPEKYFTRDSEREEWYTAEAIPVKDD